MNGYEFCATYLAVKLHFTDEKYDFFRYGGKTKISEDSFLKRKDKFQFHKLAKKYGDDEVVAFLVSNFIADNKLWTKDLLQQNCVSNYTKWKRTMESLSYKFDNDFQKIMNLGDINESFAAKDGNHPAVLTLYMQNEISLESLVILNKIMNFIPKWDKQIQEDIIYPKISFLIKKYSPFLLSSMNMDKLYNIIKKYLKAG